MNQSMKPRPPWHHLLPAAISLALALAITSPLFGEIESQSFVRTWTRLTGETLQASFIGIDGNNVVLESHPDRARYTVAIDDLCAADRGYLHSRRPPPPASASPRFSLPFSNLGKALFPSSKSKIKSLNLAARSRIDGTPDFLQTHRAARLPLAGTQHCGPAAASNALVYLSLTGYPNLALNGDTPQNRQISLVRALGSAAFMKTDRSGTSPWNVATGLDSFVRFRGYSPRKLEFQGWQPVPRRHTSRHKTPQLQSARDTLTKPRGAVLVNIGFYRADNNRYTRKDGHWITAVGFKDPYTLLAYDPSPRTGSEKTLHEITLAPLPFGALSLSDWEDPVPTKGYHYINSPYPTPDPRFTTIIDGFLILELR